jgi:hypothetical protein
MPNGSNDGEEQKNRPNMTVCQLMLSGKMGYSCSRSNRT